MRKILLVMAGSMWIAAAGGCSDKTSGPDAGSCPAAMPANGTTCHLANPPSPPGAVGVCGYTTETNACGAVNCYCEDAGWECGPTCVIDASTGD